MGSFGDFAKKATSNSNSLSKNQGYSDESGIDENKYTEKGKTVNYGDGYDIFEVNDVDYTATTAPYSSGSADFAQDFFSVPKYGIKDFLNERVAWQKGTESLAGGKGLCYFKLFFNFISPFGLLSGLVNDSTGTPPFTANSAKTYLMALKNSDRLTTAEKTEVHHRLIALTRFANALSYINTNAPWFFKEVSNMDAASQINLDKLTDEKTIDIKCMPDAIDMRLTTLLDLYKFVCYDRINQKEIIPENLRKFDLQIVVFQSPIRYYQTSIKSANGKHVGYKSLYDDDFTNRMSFKMVTFKNCEFDVASMSSISNSLSNEAGFDLDYTIKIKYDRAYEHNLNEWMQVYFGGNEIIWDTRNGINKPKGTPAINKRISAIKYALNHIYYYNPKSANYQGIIDASEDVITNAMRMIDNDSWVGNAFKKVSAKLNKAIDAIDGKNASIKRDDKTYVNKMKAEVPYSEGIQRLLDKTNELHQPSIDNDVDEPKKGNKSFTSKGGNNMPVYYSEGIQRLIDKTNDLHSPSTNNDVDAPKQNNDTYTSNSGKTEHYSEGLQKMIRPSANSIFIKEVNGKKMITRG